MKEAAFDIEISPEDLTDFARISGDWNPLHTDADYAASGPYKAPILHGAFAAGLFSRLAGMHIPGRDCLLRGMRLRFLAPIVPPSSVRVSGRLTGAHRVNVVISDRNTGKRYTEGSYEFGIHNAGEEDPSTEVAPGLLADQSTAVTAVTGATGGVGRAVLRTLGENAVGLSRGPSSPGILTVEGYEDLNEVLGTQKLSGIVHCAWPQPDNTPLLDIADLNGAMRYHLTDPVTSCISLAKHLALHGVPGAILILVGSTFAEPGRHAYRTPAYSLAKSTIETLTRILALELSRLEMRCASIVLDVVDGGMNAGLDRATFIAHADRVPSGRLPVPEQVAEQISWMLANSSNLINGSVLPLTGGALP